MRYLLDTHTFVWLATDDARLSDAARRRAIDSRNELVLSVVSCWEIAIKSSLGKLELATHAEAFVEGQLEDLQAELLSISAAHALGVERLPFHHRDPFDRALISVAIVEDLPVLGADAEFDAYPIERIW